jgi:hypothetical protein
MFGCAETDSWCECARQKAEVSRSLPERHMQLSIPSSSCHILTAAGAAGAKHKLGAATVQAHTCKHLHSSGSNRFTNRKERSLTARGGGRPDQCAVGCQGVLVQVPRLREDVVSAGSAGLCLRVGVHHPALTEGTTCGDAAALEHAAGRQVVARGYDCRGGRQGQAEGKQSKASQ